MWKDVREGERVWRENAEGYMVEGVKKAFRFFHQVAHESQNHFRSDIVLQDDDLVWREEVQAVNCCEMT